MYDIRQQMPMSRIHYAVGPDIYGRRIAGGIGDISDHSRDPPYRKENEWLRILRIQPGNTSAGFLPKYI
jgi:hypothetical protein